MDRTKIAGIVTTLSTGIFAGAQVTPVFGLLDAFAIKEVPPPVLLKEFRIWVEIFSALSSITAVIPLGITLGSSIWAIIKRQPVNLNFLATGLLLFSLIPFSSVVFKQINQVFWVTSDEKAIENAEELRQLVHLWKSYQYVRLGIAVTAFSTMVIAPLPAIKFF